MYDQNTIAACLERGAREFAARPLVLYEDHRISYEQMDLTANRVANAFSKMGVSKGDKVIILLENCPQWLYVWFGLAKIGAIAVPLNTAHKGDILAHMIDSADAAVMVAGEGFVENLAAVQDRLNQLKTLIVYPDTAAASGAFPKKIPFAELLTGEASPPDCEVYRHDAMAIMYTSGTTGLSKGVLQPNNQYVWCGENVAGSLNMQPGDVFYCWFPLFHIVGSAIILMSCLLSGSAVALARRFSLSRFWRDIKKYDASLTGGFATMIELLFKQPPQTDDADNSLRHILVGHPPRSIHRSFEERFGVIITDEYGMTEIEPISYCSIKARHSRPGTCGRPVPDIEVRIFDETDNELAAGKVGEIVVRPKKPYIMMQQYHNAPDKTVEAWRNLWFHTGDFGYLDADGYLYFVDRKKDCIRRRGENISSYELESIINTHPDVLECAAVGVAAELGDEDVKVAIKLKQNRSLAPEEVLRFCQDRMAEFMIPRYVEFVDEFPRTETSKILKRDLKNTSDQTWDREKAGFRLKNFATIRAGRS